MSIIEKRYNIPGRWQKVVTTARFQASQLGATQIHVGTSILQHERVAGEKAGGTQAEKRFGRVCLRCRHRNMAFLPLWHRQLSCSAYVARAYMTIMLNEGRAGSTSNNTHVPCTRFITSAAIRGSISTAVTFLAFSKILTVRLPVPGPTSSTLSVGLRFACVENGMSVSHRRKEENRLTASTILGLGFSGF